VIKQDFGLNFLIGLLLAESGWSVVGSRMQESRRLLD
jgi:hypothetical protein